MRTVVSKVNVVHLSFLPPSCPFLYFCHSFCIVCLLLSLLLSFSQTSFVLVTPPVHPWSQGNEYSLTWLHIDGTFTSRRKHNSNRRKNSACITSPALNIIGSCDSEYTHREAEEVNALPPTLKSGWVVDSLASYDISVLIYISWRFMVQTIWVMWYLCIKRLNIWSIYIVDTIAVIYCSLNFSIVLCSYISYANV